MKTRTADQREEGAILALLEQVQAHLRALGSPQALTVIDAEAVDRHIRAGTAHVLVVDSTIVGVTFVQPLTSATLPELLEWGLAVPERTTWFLQTLAIAPERQGHGHGLRLLDGIKEHVASHGPGILALDCFAGNRKLREFYLRAGFELVGEFPTTQNFAIAVFAWYTP